MKSGSKQKLPFEVTPQHKRYLDDIIFTHNEWRSKDLNLLYLFEKYVPPEEYTPAKAKNNQLFWIFLSSNLKATKILSWSATSEDMRISEGEPSGVFAVARTHKSKKKQFKIFSKKLAEAENKLIEVIKSKNPGIVIPKPERYIVLKVLDIEAVEKLRKEIEVLLQAENGDSIGNIKRFIRMDGEGDFLIGKHRDMIPFKSKKAGYYKVFVAIYKGAGGSSASVTYKKIAEHIRIHFGGKELTIKEIQNHINNSIKHRYIEERTPDGKEIISADSEGKSVYFYNPTID